ncbi:MAG: hypothetical protein P8O81_01885, partial [Flavobacteriaceae bacterium]|nr:hypothetical protein [Flavobacteriaceae bacterium]
VHEWGHGWCFLAKSLDAYATSFMAMPIKKSKEVISNLENIDVMIIYYDENKKVKVLKSNGFNKLILD